MKNNTRKILLALLVVMTLLVSMATLTVHAADGSVVKLDPGAEWSSDGARYAVYYWDNAGNHWTDMTDSDSDGIYEATIPAGYTDIIFCRMDPNAGNGWENVWTQTINLTLQPEETFKITDPWAGDGKKASGEWSNGAEVGGSTGDNTGSGSVGEFTTLTVAGVAGLCQTEWNPGDTYNDMTFNETTGLYERTFTGIPAGSYKCKVVADHDWNNQSWGGNNTDNTDSDGNYLFTTIDLYNITITFNPETGEVNHITSDPTAPEERPDDSGVDFESSEKVTIYLGNDAGWEKVFVHAFVEKGNNDVPYQKWPGLEMKWDSEKMVYYAEIPSVCDFVVFNAGEGKTQTGDLAIPKDGSNLYENLSNSWMNIKNYTPPIPPTNTTEDVTVYVKDTAGWGAVYIYFWDENGIEATIFPGVEMTKGEDGYWYYTIPAGNCGVLFTNGIPDKASGLEQTVDFVIPTNGKNYINNTAESNSEWYSADNNTDSGDDNTGDNNQGGNTGDDSTNDQPAKEMTLLQKMAKALLLFLRKIEEIFKGIFKK